MEHQNKHQHPSIPLKQIHTHACGGGHDGGCCGGCKNSTDPEQPKAQDPANQNTPDKDSLSRKKRTALGLAGTFAAIGKISMFTLQKDTAYF